MELPDQVVALVNQEIAKHRARLKGDETQNELVLSELTKIRQSMRQHHEAIHQLEGFLIDNHVKPDE